MKSTRLLCIPLNTGFILFTLLFVLPYFAEAKTILKQKTTANSLLIVEAKGSHAGGAFAHFKVYVNDKEIGNSFTSSNYEQYQFNVPNSELDVFNVQISFDNDAVINGQDRNLFIKNIEIFGEVIEATGYNVTYRRKNDSEISYNGVMPWSGDLIFDIKNIPNPCQNNVVLSSQAEVDAFACTRIRRVLTISGEDISNLKPLSKLEFVQQLRIKDNPQLSSLDGLNLQDLVMVLEISNNALLKDISALKSHDGVGTDLIIKDNQSLENLSGLEHINGVQNVNISGNESLKNLDGLASLNNARSLTISANGLLENINGLANLTGIDYRGDITDNPKLTEFCGLFTLIKSGDRSIQISGNTVNPTYEEILAAGPCGQTSEGELLVTAKGSEAAGVFAHFKVYVNNQEIGNSFTTDKYQSYYFALPIEPEAINKIQITFDNDAFINGQDRNLFVQNIAIGEKNIKATQENVTYRRKNGDIIPYSGAMPWSGDLIFNIEQEPQVCEGDITLTSQAEVDAFACTEIKGGLTVSGNDINNLQGLSKLKAIGFLRIENNPKLESLEGLNADLDDVVYDVIIRNNSQLKDISALKGMPVGFTISINNNPALKNLDGLQHVGGVRSLSISGNSSLKNLDELSSLEEVRAIEIYDNASLENINGLSSLSHTDYGGRIYGNPKLTEFCGLYTLINSGTRAIEIYGNAVNPTFEEILATGPCNQKSEVELLINAKGSQAGGVFALFKVYVNNQEVGSGISTANYQSFNYNLSIAANEVTQVKISFENDAVINGEDRNLFVQNITIGDKNIEATGENVTYRRKNGSIIPYNGVMPWSGDLIFNSTNANSRVANLSGSQEVEEIFEETEISIYPNPSNGKFHVSLGNKEYERLQFDIIDRTGKHVYTKQIDGNNQVDLTIDISNFINGMYYLRLTSNQFIVTEKLIKN